MKASEFSEWFGRNADRLRELSPDKAAEEVAAELGRHDARLGAEVADEDGTRELIVTAFGEASLFGLVGALCRGAVRPGWSVRSLKPARGFGFTLEIDGDEVDASNLRFEPLETPTMPETLGIRLLVPGRGADAVARPGPHASSWKQVSARWQHPRSSTSRRRRCPWTGRTRCRLTSCHRSWSTSNASAGGEGSRSASIWGATPCPSRECQHDRHHGSFAGQTT